MCACSCLAYVVGHENQKSAIDRATLTAMRCEFEELLLVDKLWGASQWRASGVPKKQDAFSDACGQLHAAAGGLVVVRYARHDGGAREEVSSTWPGLVQSCKPCGLRRRQLFVCSREMWTRLKTPYMFVLDAQISVHHEAIVA
jgi:hypothetical protein